jgi:hypothetical protein
MRLMWLWVLIYGIALGLVLFFLGLSLTVGFAFSYAGGTAGDVGAFGSGLTLFAVMGGFVALIAGVILFIINARSAAGRIVSLVGIALYHVAALGVIMAVSAIWVLRGFSPQVVYVYAIVAFLVVLPAVFMVRRLKRAY